MATGVNIAGELLFYAPAWFTVSIAFAVLLRRARRSAPQREAPARHSADATWFLPVYVGGICSVYHAHAALWSNLLLDPRRHPSSLQYGVLLQQGAFSAAVLALLLFACFFAEWWAGKLGLSVRSSHGALPLPVAAAIVGVLENWVLCVIAFFPLSWHR